MSVWFAKQRFEWCRKNAVKAQLPSFLQRYLEQPLPDLDGPAIKAPVLALDFETNGLNPLQDHILSIGAVMVDDAAISIGSSWHVVVSTRHDLNSDIVPIHGITHDMVSEGQPVAAAVEELLGRLQGRFLLAHHAAIEVGFLQAILKKLYGVKIPFAFIDTLTNEQKIQRGRSQSNSLRLLEARKRYGLPAYSNHHALTDALAAAELYLAQCQHHIGKTPVSRLLGYYH